MAEFSAYRVDEKRCYTWDGADILWNDNPYTWDDVCLVIKLVGGSGDDPSLYNLTKEEQTKFIKLYFKVKRQTEPDSWYKMRNMDSMEVELEDVEITADDIRMVVKNVLNIKVEV